MPIRFDTEMPDSGSFFSLYETTGWNRSFGFSPEELASALKNSWFMVSAYDGERLVGFGRIVSDGVYQAFICDLIVHPDYQRQKIGTQILGMLLEKCEAELPWVQLFSAEGKADFYKRFGFVPRKDSAPGMQRIFRKNFRKPSAGKQSP